MEKKPDWMKDLEKKNFLDRFHLSVHELSEMGIGWLITSFVILYITGNLNRVIFDGVIPDELLIYLFVLGISFFGHELAHKFVAIKFGAKAYFRLSREKAWFLTLANTLIRLPFTCVNIFFLINSSIKDSNENPFGSTPFLFAIFLIVSSSTALARTEDSIFLFPL